jgi:hypothetical protein
MPSWSGRFQWCSPESAAELSDQTVTWQQGQPDNEGGSQNCLLLNILTDYSQTVAVSDQECNSNYSFACQVCETRVILLQKRENITNNIMFKYSTQNFEKYHVQKNSKIIACGM